MKDNPHLLRLVQYILPVEIFEYFEITKIEEQGKELHIYLDENPALPSGYSTYKLSSKGFIDEISVQDFPIRGHQVYLHITRRRWLNEDTGKVVFRDWNLVADGTRVTQEFASFLKEINRFQAL